MNTDIRIYNFKTGETATEKAAAIQGNPEKNGR